MDKGGHGADAEPTAENFQASFAFPAGAAKGNEETEEPFRQWASGM